MSIEEFDKTGFNAGTTVNYKGKEYLVGSVCFQEKLLGIYPPETEDLDAPHFRFDWVRCENVEFLY